MRRGARRSADFEVMHNLVLETTRTGHRGEEPQDARRIAGQPPRVQRTARPRARERRGLQAGQPTTARSSDGRRASPAATSVEKQPATARRAAADYGRTAPQPVSPERRGVRRRPTRSRRWNARRRPALPPKVQAERSRAAGVAAGAAAAPPPPSWRMARLKAAPQQNRTRLPATNWTRTSKRASLTGPKPRRIDEAPRLQEAPSAIAHSLPGVRGRLNRSTLPLRPAAHEPDVRQARPAVRTRVRRADTSSRTGGWRSGTRSGSNVGVPASTARQASGRNRRTRRWTRAVKLAIVVQRYGPAINGGAELHARYIAEHLARHADVEVLTTCATDYVTWRNELPAGVESRQRRAGAAVPREARARSARCSESCPTASS